MSSTFLVVIPKDPDAPLPETAEDLKNALARMAGTDEARVKDYGKLQFIDCGGNFESISCPNCNALVSTEDWHNMMEADWHGEEGFHLHGHRMSCCSQSRSLDDLVYRWPQGFARWFVGARADNRGALTGHEMAQLQEIAGMPLRAIIQRY